MDLKDFLDKIQGATKTLLETVDPNPERAGIAETPARVSKAWAKYTEGYHQDAKSILKVFEDGAESYDQMVIVNDIPIYSHCEHHLAPIFGIASIAYIPNGRIVGLSKLSRLANMHARRLQVQERMTNDIAEDLDKHLSPLGVGVIMRCRHFCMEARGLCQQGHHTVTSALRGAIKDDQKVREEFMMLTQSKKVI